MSPAGLVESLRRMREEHACVGVKLSTEDAGMPPEQIAFYAGHLGAVVPVGVKIGGPEARADLRMLRSLRVGWIVAPMVESPFGLEKFVEAARDVYGETVADLDLAVNLESRTAVEQAEAILADPAAAHIAHVTVGRTDLARSMKLGVDDDPVMAATERVLALARARGKKVYVGGGITPANALRIKEQIAPDCFETRLFVFETRRCADPQGAVTASLRAEQEMLRLEAERGWIDAGFAERRIADLARRLGDVRG